MFCRNCGAEINASATNCQTCGGRAVVHQEPPIAETRRVSYVAIALALASLALVLGNFHIITGKNVGLKIATRESFGFSEILVNADTITSIPIIAAVMKYPLGVHILQRDGYIESFDDMQKRVMDEVMEQSTEAMDEAMKTYGNAMDEAMKNASAAQEQAMRDAQREYERAMRDLENMAGQ